MRNDLTVSFVSTLLVVKSLNVIYRALPRSTMAVQSRVSICDVYNSLPLHMADSISPISPVCFVTDQERNEHTRIHVFDMKPSEPPAMA